MGLIKAIFGFLKKLWDVLRPILAVVLICLAIYFTFGGVLTAGGLGLTSAMFAGLSIKGTAAALIAVGAAAWLSPTTVSKAVSAVGDAAKEVLSTAAGVVTGVVTGSPLFALLVGGGLFYFLSTRKKKDETAPVPAAPALQGVQQ